MRAGLQDPGLTDVTQIIRGLSQCQLRYDAIEISD